MKSAILVILAIVLPLSACSSAPPTPELPADAKTQSFVFKREVFQRGLRGGTSYREPRLLNHVYTLTCIADDPERSAKARFEQARSLINASEPLVYENQIGEGYQKSFHRKRVNQRVVEKTGCQSAIAWEIITTDTREILLWAVKNGVLLEATGRA